MKKIYCFLLLALLTAPLLYAQTPTDSTARKGRWEVGLDLLWLIDKNQVPANSIFFRRNYLTKEGKNRAWRFRFGFGASAGLFEFPLVPKNEPPVPLLDKKEQQTISPYLRMGYEWQYLVGKNTFVFYGVETHVNYNWSHYYEKTVDCGDNCISKDTEKRLFIGPVGILGFKTQLLPWLLLSAESSASAIYMYRRIFSESYDASQPNPAVAIGHTRDRRFMVGMAPITTLSLNINLNQLLSK